MSSDSDTRPAPAVEPAAPNAAPTVAAGVRLPYDQLPIRVRHWVEARLGSTVTRARTQTGGFSPGSAARLETASGRRAFVKAVGAELNPETPKLFRDELAAVRSIPAIPWAPRLLEAYDDGDWIALLFEDIEGRQAAHPWTPEDVDLVFGALTDLSAALTPTPWADAQVHGPRLAEGGWDEFVAEPPEDLPPWILRHLPELAAMPARAAAAVRGESLVHLDIRADNLLITPERRVVFVDWAWARRAAPWVDAVLTAFDVPISGSTVDVDLLLGRHPLTRGLDPSLVTDLVGTYAGKLESAARRPVPPGLPTIRAYQRHVADTLHAWARRRTGW